MPPIILLAIVYSFVFLLTYACVKLFRKWSLRRKLFDIPNERSSHTTPTPRGGGIVIVIVCLTAYSIYTFFITGKFSWAYVAGAMLVAGISWLDDLYDVSFVFRILIHAAAAIILISSIGYFDQIYLPFNGQIVKIEFFGIIATVLWIIWLTNAFNFMDGIDGIATMQTITAGVGWLIVCFMLGYPSTGFYGGILASAGLGFLILNWQPAKIFMGDVGSAFLGFTFAALPLLAGKEILPENENIALLPWLAVLINWFFIFDTIFTVCKRIFNKEKIWEAHRSHLYQRMVIAGVEHRKVSLLYGVLSILVISTVLLRLKYGSDFDFTLFTLTALQTIGLIFFIKYLNKKNKI